MAISSIGIGSGLEVETIVKQLVALESKPIAALQTKATGINTQISAFSQLKSQISNLQDQLDKLTKPATWLGNTLTSSNSAQVTGSATSSAVQATYDVEVSQMAAGQTIGSGLVASGTTLGPGKLTISMGTYGANGLTPNTKDGKNVSFSVDITAEDDSLAKIAAKINAAKGDVSATVLKDHTGERLVLQSKTTGVNSAFSVEAEGAGLQQFAYNGTDGTMKRSVKAQDTLAKINGIDMASHTNVFEDVAAGVTLTVAQKSAADAAPVRITIANDTATAKTALKNLVESYNALSNALKTMTAYDKDSKTAGTLQGDSTAINLQSAMRRLLSGPGGEGGAFTSLSQMGIAFQTDGTLKIDDTKLDKALKDPESMSKFFTSDVADANQDGLAVRMKDFTSGLLATGGTFSTKDETLKNALKRNTADQERQSARVTAYEARVRAQYSRLDTQMASLKALDTYVAQQVAAWNKSSS
ncbi:MULTISPECIES: flagellar filament capping protein FliD [Comamonas]|uniref:flagellar filament capping protein FliD n=1 Tax=Comamonas TaxID=283 RepID=UPI00050DD8EB|nr:MULTISPECIES: flagellar filament capping protein FliD [Comamonas]KGG94055.1 flagellar hook protein [Comamonas thiooxydans]KGH01222.1 flagellar hook protein [Comamonas thiooxydans]KGH06726.1 flagellar hook protein [Comamonas thiooxydans]KGH14869.1 flagellar hook protein [Comamonas thiooxydans]TZG09969.1 flagellar filament capping protein FliD [Comamonas thiooxydans]